MSYISQSVLNIPDTGSVKLCLTSRLADELQAHFIIAKLAIVRDMKAYHWRFVDPLLKAWVEEPVSLMRMHDLNMHLYEVRRSTYQEEPRTRPEETRGAFMSRDWPPFGLIIHEEEEPGEMFDRTRLLDLPPPGWPYIGGEIEFMRAAHESYDAPRTQNQRWAYKQTLAIRAFWKEDTLEGRVIRNLQENDPELRIQRIKVAEERRLQYARDAVK